MLDAITVPKREALACAGRALGPEETITTFVRREEFAFLRDLHASPTNTCPQFSLADLTSACVSLVFRRPEGAEDLFTVARTELALRAPALHRCRSELWPAQFALLREAQRSHHNRSPHPRFDLGDLSTACVALVISSDQAQGAIIEEARRNLSVRMQMQRAPVLSAV